MTTVVFVGPSLPRAEVVALAPHAQIEGPAVVGEVLRAVVDGAQTIVLLDGMFEQMAAVWHKELLYGLERRVRILGAASMGALRAAELAPFGMEPVGRIAHAYARGQLRADDEVAVAHAPAEFGYQAMTVPLVNVRATLQAAARAKRLAPRSIRPLLEAARAVFYRERDLATLARAWKPHSDGAAAVDAMRHHSIDPKAQDARAALRRLRRPPAVVPPAIVVERTWAFRQLWQQVIGGDPPPVNAVSDAAARLRR